MATSWNTAHRYLTKRLKNVVKQIAYLDAGNNVVPEALVAMRDRLQEILPQIQARMDRFAERGAAIIEDGQQAMILTAIDGQEALATAMVGPVPSGVSLDWNYLPEESFEALVGMAGNGSPLYDLLKQATGEHLTAVTDELLAGMAQGLNPREVAATMAARGKTGKARMQTIARTEMLRASREATRRTYEANADIVTGYVRVSAQDLRTCPACWALHGTEYHASDILPTHPNCRCTMAPITKSWAEITGDDSLPDTRPEIGTGDAAFGDLSEADQKAILGQGRFAAYQAGTALSEMAAVENDPEWGPSVRVKNVEELTGA